MIEFSCPYCSAVMKFDIAFAGKTVKCLKCQREMIAPDLSAAAAAPPAPPLAAGAAPGAAPAAPAPATVAAAQEMEVLERETLQSFIHKLLVLVVLIAAQWAVTLLAGVDIAIRGIRIDAWLHLILAIAIIVFMLLILSPLRRLVPYYIGVIFRVQPRLAAEPELKTQVSRAATYFILLVYLAIFYWAVVVSLQEQAAWTSFIFIARLTVAVIGLFFLVLFVLAIRPLLHRASSRITDHAMAATQKLDSKPCAGCGARVPLTAKFCPGCGKPA